MIGVLMSLMVMDIVTVSVEIIQQNLMFTLHVFMEHDMHKKVALSIILMFHLYFG